MNPVQEMSLPGNSQVSDLAQGSIFFIGTATVLLRYAGFTILTDPNFLHQGDHVHLGYGLTSARVTNPAIEIEDLPPLDFVMLSHMHEDHFDSIAAEKLNKNVPIISTYHAKVKLQKQGFTAPTALNPWESLTISKGENSVRITAMPGRHGPKIIGSLLPPVIGSLLEFQSAQKQTVFRLYISGDTLVYDDIREIPKRHPNIDLALLHLGGTKAFGILVTMDAKQGVQAIQIISPKLSIPIHYNDYTVFKSPLEDFIKAVAEASLEQQVRYLTHGETYYFSVDPSRSI